MKGLKEFLKSRTFLVSFLGLLAIIAVITTAYLASGNKQVTSNTKAATEMFIVEFDKQNVVAANGETFTVTLRAGTGAIENIQLYEVNLSFDKTKVNLNSITYNSAAGTPTNGLADTNSTLSSINNKGNINIFAESTDPNGISYPSTTTVDLVTLEFKSLSSSVSEIGVDASKNNEFIKISTNGEGVSIPVNMLNKLIVNPDTTSTTAVTTSTTAATTSATTSVTPVTTSTSAVTTTTSPVSTTVKTTTPVTTTTKVATSTSATNTTSTTNTTTTSATSTTTSTAATSTVIPTTTTTTISGNNGTTKSNPVLDIIIWTLLILILLVFLATGIIYSIKRAKSLEKPKK